LVDSSQVDSRQVDSSQSAKNIISGWCGSSRYCSLQSYDISRPNMYICAMDDNNDTQHMNTVRNFEVS